MTCPNCHRSVTPTQLTCPACGAVVLALPVGTRLYHRYRILQALRRTGGISYLAEDEEHQRQVLVLEFFPAGSRRLGTLAILPEGADSRRTAWIQWIQGRGEVTDQYLQRAQAVFDQHGTSYAVAPLPLGDSLLDRVHSGRLLDPTEAQAMLSALAQGVAALQRHGQVDGRIDPGRVSLTPAGARLDLGWLDESPGGYEAPEQLRVPSKTLPGSDVYALAALTLFALTGEVPPVAAQRALGQALPLLPSGLPIPLRQATEQGLKLQNSERLPDAAALLRVVTSSGAAGITPGRIPAERTVKVISAHQSWLMHVYSDGERIVTAGADLRLRVFDRTGQALRQFDGLQGRPTGLFVGESGIVAGDDSGTVTVWSGTTGTPLAQTGRWRMTHLVVRSGKRAVTLQDDGALGVWELDGPRQLGQAPFSAGRFTALHVSADDLLTLGTFDGQVQVLDETTLLPVPLWQHPDWRMVTAIASPNQGAGLYAVATAQQVTLIDQGTPVLVLDLQEPVSALAFSPDGTALAMAGRAGGLHCHHLQSGQTSLLHRSPAALRTVHWSDSLLVAGNEAGQLLIVPPPQPRP